MLDPVRVFRAADNQVRRHLRTKKRRRAVLAHERTPLQRRRGKFQSHPAFLPGLTSKDIRDPCHHGQVLQIQSKGQRRQERLRIWRVPVRPLDRHPDPAGRRQGREQFLPSALRKGR